MSNHKLALVPIASGHFQSPELLAAGRKADTGIFAEALVYYDSVYVHVDNPEQFADFISLLIQQGLSLESLNELIEEGSLGFYATVTMHPFMGYGLGPRTIVSSFHSIQEKAMLEPNYFTKRFLEFEGLQGRLHDLSGFDRKTFDKFRQLAEKNAIAFSSEDIGDDIVDSAYEDFLNPVRCKHITKSIFEEYYRARNLGEVPDFDVKIREMGNDNYVEIANNPHSAVIGRHLSNGGYTAYEVDFSISTNNLKSLETGNPIIAFPTLPLSCAGVSNLYIKSAGKLKCDLFLPKPMSNIIGDKLYEIDDLGISRKHTRVKNVIENLEAKVEFPDLRNLVNASEINFNKVLEIRKNAKPFREWLQTEAERDGDAIVAYHGEVARQSGFTNIDKKSLQLFGVLALLSIYTKIQFKEDVVTNEDIRTMGDRSPDFLFDYGARKLGDDWKPVCFGNWYKDEITRLLKRSKDGDF